MTNLVITSLFVVFCFSATITAQNICDPVIAESGLLKGLLTNNLKDYVVVAGAGYSFAGGTGSTHLTGNLASFPTASPLNGNPMVTLNGMENLNATETTQLALDIITTYNNGLSKLGRIPIAGDIGGLTKTPGVYFSTSTIGITGSVTLDALGDPNAVFIFIAGSALFTGPDANIVLFNGAQACHVYWIVGSSATINVRNQFFGNINALASITVISGSVVEGRLFARAAVTIDSSHVSVPMCTCETAGTSPSAPPPPPPPTPVPTSPFCPVLAESGLLTSNLKDYAIFAGSGYTFAGGPTSVTGNIGSYPTASPTSGSPFAIVNGLENFNTTETSGLAQDVIQSYNNGFSKSGRIPISGDIGGQNKNDGVYYSTSTIAINGTLTLNARGDPNAVFIFIAGSALTTGADSNINLINGAQACHVYWIVGSSATLSARSRFVGTINAAASITVVSGGILTGRLLARAAVTIDSSILRLPVCAC